MSLTPMDIHNKEFNTKLRGYDEGEVDSFLDRIVDAFGDALDKNIDLQNSNTELKKKNKELEDKIAEYDKIKDSLNQSLIAAQENADKIKQKAQAEANDLLSQAKDQASDKTEDLQKQYDILNNDYELLKGKVADFRVQTKKLLQDQLDELDDNDWQYYLDKYYGRSRLYPADGSQPVLVDDQDQENQAESNEDTDQTADQPQTAPENQTEVAAPSEPATSEDSDNSGVTVNVTPASEPAESSSDDSEVDKDQTNEVNSDQGSQDDQPKIMEGDSPSSEDDGLRKPAVPDPSVGPTIIFPDDYKNHD